MCSSLLRRGCMRAGVCVFVCVRVHLCVKAALFLIEGKLSRAVWKIQGHWSPVTCAVWERACVIECLWECLALSFSLSGCVTEKEASGKEQRISSGFPSMYGKGDCVSAWLCVCMVIPCLCLGLKDLSALQEIMQNDAEATDCMQYCSSAVFIVRISSSSFIFHFRHHRFSFIHTTLHQTHTHH